MNENTKKLMAALNQTGNRQDQVSTLLSTLNWSHQTLVEETENLHGAGANISPVYEIGNNGLRARVRGIRVLNEEEQFVNAVIDLNGTDNIVEKIQRKLGWPDDKMRRIALKVEREGAPICTLIDNDGGPPGKLVGVELIRMIDASTYIEPAKISMLV